MEELSSKMNNEITVSHECKICKKTFKCLLQHLNKFKLCGQEYQEWEIEKLKTAAKSHTKNLKNKAYHYKNQTNIGARHMYAAQIKT